MDRNANDPPHLTVCDKDLLMHLLGIGNRERSYLRFQNSISVQSLLPPREKEDFRR